MKRNTAIFLTFTLLLMLIQSIFAETALADAKTETTTIDVINSKTVRIINDGAPVAYEPGEWSPSYGARFNYVGYDEDAGKIYEEESVLQFDLDKLRDKSIVSAKLKLDVLFGSDVDWGIWASNDHIWESGATIPDKTLLINNGTRVEVGINAIDVTSFFASGFNEEAEKAIFIISHTDPSKKGSQSYFAFYSMGDNLPGHRKQPALEVTYEIINKPPTGQIDIIANENHFVKDRNVVLQITGEDPDGDAMEINISNSSTFADKDWKPFTSPHVQDWELPEGDGLKKVYMQLRDVHGNRSDVYEASVTLDTTKPTGIVTITKSAEYITNPHVMLVIESDDLDVDQMRFSNQEADWSSSTWVPYATTHGWTLDATEDGYKKVYMQLRDKAGNDSVPIASNTIFLDATAPKGTLAINHGATHTKDPKVHLTLTADDGKGTNFVQMSFSNNKQRWTGWEPFETSKEWYLIADEGLKTVYMKLRDAAGNESEDEISGSIYLDLTPPTGSITLNGGAKYTSSRDVKLSVSADDGGGAGDIQVQFSNDEQTWHDAQWLDYDNPTEAYDWQLTEGDGEKFVYMKLRDGLGHESASPIRSAPIILDTTPSIPPSPDAPALHSPIAENAQVRLAWDSVNGATGYKIYHSQIAGQYGTETATVTGDVYGYTVTGLTNGTTYYFVLKAESPGGLSEASNEVSATPMTVPAAPTDVKAIAGNGRATISFNVPSDHGGSPITGYEVSDQHGNIVATADSGPMTITGLTNGERYTFTVKAINEVGKSLASEPSNEIIPRAPSNNNGNGGSGPPVSPPATEPKPDERIVDIIVNGQVLKAGIAITEMINHQQVTTITLDADSLEQRLAEGDQGFVISITWLDASDVVIGALSGRMVKDMEEAEAVIELITANATYTIPALQIDINELAKQFGADIALQDIEIQIAISALTEEQMQVVEEVADNGDFAIVAPPVNFTVKAVYKNTSRHISTFDAYVKRTITIPDNVDPGKMTTAIVIESDGTIRHVPTKIASLDGQYIAVIHSMSNSTYLLIHNPIVFQDITDHGAKDIIHNMAARKIVYGIDDQSYRPDQETTRAEFAAMVVRALGLKSENSSMSFIDVKPSDWYSGVIQTAHAHNLINGFGDGTFRPNDQLTREQAMVILSKTLEITKQSEQSQKPLPEQLLDTFIDATEVSAWAKNGVAASLQAGVVTGRNNEELAPKENITRAEVAVIIHRLLRHAGLI